MTRPSTDHVVIVARDGELLQCRHCGAGHQPTLPMPSARFETVLRGFSLMHRLCPKPEAPSPQMALPGTEIVKPPSVDPYDREREFCSHKFVDSKNCLKCGISFAELKAESLRASQRLNGIDASTDEPAPEIDPPGPYQLFREMYPIATNPLALHDDLRLILSKEQWDQLPSEMVWHPASGIFNAVANWARIEKAHAEAGAREPIAGLTLPRREPMPEKLAELLGVKPKQKKGARPLVNPKRKGKTATP